MSQKKVLITPAVEIKAPATCQTQKLQTFTSEGGQHPGGSS
jgi:hypothetical protein